MLEGVEAAGLGTPSGRGLGTPATTGVWLACTSALGGALKYVQDSSREMQLEHGGPLSSHCDR